MISPQKRHKDLLPSEVYQLAAVNSEFLRGEVTDSVLSVREFDAHDALLAFFLSEYAVRLVGPLDLIKFLLGFLLRGLKVEILIQPCLSLARAALDSVQIGVDETMLGQFPRVKLKR